MYRIAVNRQETTEILLKSEELGDLITRAVNLRSFHFDDNHSLTLEQNLSGGWTKLDGGKGLEALNSSIEKELKI